MPRKRIFTKQHRENMSKSATKRYKDPKEHEKISGKNNPNYKDGRTLKKYYCDKCGKQITIQSKSGMCCFCCLKGKKRKTFTQATRLKISKSLTGRKASKLTREKMSESHKGKNHWNYKDGLSKLPYSYKFTSILRELIKERDSFKCQHCNITQEEHLEKYNRDIEVHHIDYNKFNCDENNLITVCKKCNVKANYNRDYWYAYFNYKMENNNANIIL
jgi:hypothetical protein